MSRTSESRKPRAEARVRDLAQENERLQLALREEQARHDAKVADVKAMEKRIGELRRELDTAAALHREVKARLEGEITRLGEVVESAGEAIGRLNADNTRLEKELADAAAERRGRMPLKDELAKADALNTRHQEERRGIATRIHGIGVELNGLHDVVLAAQEDADLVNIARRLNELARCCCTAVPALAPASNKSPDCNPAGSP